MAAELTTWERPRFVEGGGTPFLFYVLMGEINAAAPMSRSKYRSGGIPDGIDVMQYGPGGHPEVAASFREGFLWNQFAAEHPDLAATVAQCKHCTILQGEPTDSTTLNYLRDLVGLITFLAENGGHVIYDPFMFRWWPIPDWKEQIFEPAEAVPHRHTVTLISNEDDASLKWFHTRGMRKFGRPDISVHNVPAELEDGVQDLCNQLIAYQAQGGVIRGGQEFNLPSLPCGGVLRHAGDLDDPDFNNFHIDVTLHLPR
jgi:hypothetical protein